MAALGRPREGEGVALGKPSDGEGKLGSDTAEGKVGMLLMCSLFKRTEKKMCKDKDKINTKYVPEHAFLTVTEPK